MATYTLTTPLTSEDTKKLVAGDTVLLNGTIYTARDAAHKRLVDLIEAGEELPFDLEGSIIYFGATGGAGALLGKQIRSAEVIAYPELGPEAVRKITVEDFPVTVVNDTKGNDIYQMGRAQYEVKS
jgi:fumarate hydratase subunit beta